MAKSDRSPWSDLLQAHHRLQQILDLYRRETSHGISRSVVDDDGTWPPVDIAEVGDELVFFVELPGVHLDDVDLQVTGESLVVRGVFRSASWRPEMRPYQVERQGGRFQRSFRLPGRVDPEAVSANLNDGVLEVRVPRASTPASRQINVT